MKWIAEKGDPDPFNGTVGGKLSDAGRTATGTGTPRQKPVVVRENGAVRPFGVTNAERCRIFLTTGNPQTIASGDGPKLFTLRSVNQEIYLIPTTGFLL
ncbi:hypothetical protein [Burkholderia sp. LAS2]|uniref:hypothetical protein n=1 Tax=Burkholderia sp. LAS2 TaxID=2813843 RepID=UPI001BCA6900|nr:hypothetical protein [Burkholderia sp. LAS2]QVN16281.1 hypothetical protein JYG37_31480 [Burkholderia sp. LAS2]